MVTTTSRLLKKAHLRHPSSGWVVWIFLSSLGLNGLFSNLLRVSPANKRASVLDILGSVIHSVDPKLRMP